MTHKARVLALLSDGKAHNHHELYALHVIGHSRIADLRRDGHRIEQWREGDLYFYRLSLEQATADPASPPAAVASSSEQLVLTGAPFRRTAA